LNFPNLISFKIKQLKL